MKQFYSQKGSRVTLRKARKLHGCEDCYGDIPPKTIYMEISYMDKCGEWHTVRICLSCWGINK